MIAIRPFLVIASSLDLTPSFNAASLVSNLETICPLPDNSDIPPISSTACCGSAVVLNDADIAIRSISNNFKVVPSQS